MMLPTHIDSHPVFIAGEPPSIKLYHTVYLEQFAAIVTCHSDTPHRRKIHTQQGYPWHIGVARRPGGPVASQDYDGFIAAGMPIKCKLISVIVSDSTVTALNGPETPASGWPE